MTSNDLNRKTRELQSRLLPRQQIHSRPLTINSTVPIKRPLTRQLNSRISRDKDIDKKPKQSVLTTLKPPLTPLIPKNIIDTTPDIDINSITDPFEFIEYVRKKNLTNEFVYLYPTNIIEDENHPTRLSIIPAEKASREEFWNLSLKGLTHVKGSAVDFIPLDEWLISLKQFQKLMKVPFFKYQRQWRLFRLWRSYVNRDKLRTAQTCLTNDLFYAHSILRPACIEIQRELYKLNQIKLFTVRPDTLYTLEDFAQANSRHYDEVATIFEQFFQKLEKIVQDACEKTIENINSSDNKGKQTSSSSNSTSDSPLDRLIEHYNRTQHNYTNAVILDSSPSSLQFTQKASHRAACSKIVRFIRLVDYVVIGSLRNICFNSLLDFFAVLTSLHNTGLIKYNYQPKKKLEQLKIPIEYSRMYSLLLQKVNEAFDSPIFKVDVSYDQKLVWQPTSDDIIMRISTIRSEYIDILFKVPRLITDPSFRPYLNDNSRMQLTTEKMSTPDLVEIIFNDIVYKETIKKQNDTIVAAYKLLKFFSKSFKKAIDIFEANQKFDISFLDSDEVTSNDVRRIIKEFNEQEAFLNTITDKSEVGLFCCFTKAMKAKFVQSPKICMGKIKRKIPSVTKRFLDKYTDNINKAYSELTETIEDVGSFVFFIHACEKHKEQSKDLQRECDVIRDFYSMCLDQNIIISQDEQSDYSQLLPIHDDIKEILSNSQEKISSLMSKFSKMLEESIKKLHSDVEEVMKLAKDPKLSDLTTTIQEAANILVVIIAHTDEIHQLATNFNNYQVAMNLPKTKFDDVSELVKDVQMKQLMWETKTLWENETRKWFSVNFNLIDPNLLKDKVGTYKKNATIAAKELSENPAADDLLSTITDFSNLLPVVEDLKNPALQQNHMDQIEMLLGAKIFKAEDFSFRHLFELQAFNYVDHIHQISIQATNERTLNGMILKVKTDIEELQFITSEFKGLKSSYKFGGFEEIFSVLENSMTTISSVRSSNYVSQLRKESDDWIRSLRQFMRCLEALVGCQNKLSFVVNTINNSDITRVLSDELKEMNYVEKIWRNISTKVNDDPSAFNICTINQTLIDLESANDILEKVVKSFEKYLEIKRMGFPRLYFLSNRELMEFISQSKDPNSIIPYLPRLFDGIYNVEYKTENHIPCIISLHNLEGEKIDIRPIKYRSSIEILLSSLEEVMQRGMRKEINKSRQTYKEMVYEDWLSITNSQITHVISQIEFFESVSIAFGSVDPRVSLSHLVNETEMSISTKSKISQLDLNYANRTKIQSLISLNVLHRDILNQLIRAKAFSTKSHEWEVLFKYKWDQENKDILIEQDLAQFHYGFEFLGCNQRIVITLKTSPIFLSLSNALYMKYGGSCYGPFGSGKTETIKELSRAFAVYCVNFNCSDTITFHQISAMLRGIVQSGTWIIFSDFCRVKPEVLSILGEDFHSIRSASLGNLKKFDMDGFEVQLNQQCGIFMTSSDGKMSNFPDSLKVYFRPVAMKQIDYITIIEIQLISLGFSESHKYAIKLASFIRVCRDQFIGNNLYCFGMNTITSILSVIIELRQSHTELSDDEILLTAINKVFMKTIVKLDIPIFKETLFNYFPETKETHIVNNEFIGSLTETCGDLGYVLSPYIIEKAEQIYDSLAKYMGVIIAGDVCIGKTSLISMVEQTHNKLSSFNDRYLPIKKTIICPKAMTSSELWGFYDIDSNDWNEGLIEKVFNNKNYDNHEQWIIFDGNIDSSWVENMNSALDETRTLSLDSLRRIKLNSKFHILFETTDLSRASPSSISRCGVIHIDSSSLPWEDFFRSKIDQQIKPLFNDYPNLFSKFNEFLDSSIHNAYDYLKENDGKLMPIPFFSLFENFLDLFVVLCSSPEFQSSYSAVAMSAIFVFSYTWGFGGYLDNNQRANFDTFIRDTFTGSVTLPGRGSIYDWSVNLDNGQWKNWTESVQSFIYTADDEFETDPKNLKFYNVIVPTIETVRLNYIIKKMLLSKKNVIVRGRIGSGRRLLARTILKELIASGDCIYQSLQFSATTNSDRIHKFFNTVFEVQHQNHVLQPLGGKQSVLYVQDINTPFPDEMNSIKSIEILTQLVALHGYRPSSSLEWLNVKNITLFAIGVPDRGLGSSLPLRLSRHCLNIRMPSPDSTTSFSIINSIWQLYFSSYSESIKNVIPKLAHISLQVFDSFLQVFPSRRDKPFYSISLHDLMRLTESLLSARTKTIKTSQQLEKLWINEVIRTFCDRFDNEDDKKKFEEMLTGILKKIGSFQSVSKVSSSLYGAFKPDEDGEKVYTEYNDLSTVMEIFQSIQENSTNKRNVNDKMTLFEHYTRQITRIARVIGKKRGHMLLIGDPGTGKKSIIRFAGMICDCEVAEFEFSTSFRDELKSLILKCGVNGKEIVLIINHHQIHQPGVIDIINCIINSIDMTSFFSVDEIDKICNEIVVYAKSSGENESHENLLSLFFERAASHLHIILCLPTDSHYLQRLLSIYPSFLSMMHINYLEEWPNSAFLQYAREKFSVTLHIIDDFGEGAEVENEEEDANEQKDESKGNNKLAETFTDLSFKVYEKVKKTASKMREELQMNYFVTPALFMSFIDFFIKHMKEQNKKHRDKMIRLLIGVDKMKKMQNLAQQIERKLKENEAYLKEKVEQDEVLNDTIKQKQNDHESLHTKIKNDTAESEKQQIRNDYITKNHEAELSLVMPALNEAINSMKALQRIDLNEVKGLVEPPLPVKIVMEVICYLLSFEPDWKSSVMILSDPMFIPNIITKYDEKTHVPISVLNKINDIIKDPNFDKALTGDYSLAAKTFGQWELALINYENVYRKIEPEQNQILKESSSMQIALNELKANQDKAKDMEEFLESLKLEKDHNKREVNQLTDIVNDIKAKYNRYNKLKELLQNDSDKWNENIKILKEYPKYLMGDSFLNSIYFVFLGPFTSVYRNEIITDIKNELEQSKVLFSPNYSFVSSIIDQQTIDKWIQWGSSDETTSLENVILIAETQKSPYIIDPYSISIKWLKNAELSESQLLVMKPNSTNLLRSLEQCAKNGVPVLLEDCTEKVDQVFYPLLTKKTFEQDDKILMKFNERTIEFDQKFRMYLTTKLHNPDLSPQVFINTTVIMSIPTKEMIEKTELDSIFAAENPEMEKERAAIQAQMVADKRLLNQYQSRLIELLRKNETAILEEDIIVDAIASTKKTVDELNEKIEAATNKINEFISRRNKFTPVTKRVGILFDIAHSLSHISCIYSYSFELFRSTSVRSIINTPKEDPAKFENEDLMLEKRIDTLKKAVTFDLFTTISESIFQKHRLLFAFLVACRVMIMEGKLPENHFKLFMYGTEIIESPFENPLPNLITNEKWNELHSISLYVPNLKELTSKMIADAEDLKKIFIPTNYDLLDEYFNKLTKFEKVLVVKLLIPDKISYFLTDFISCNIGPEYVNPNPFSLEKTYELTRPTVPLIFYLNKNVDQRIYIDSLAEKHKMTSKLVTISFGQNINLNIESLVHLSANRGAWLFIQNIHLSEDLCRQLDVAVSNISENTAHHDFRLFLTTEITDKIPISLIRLSMKKSLEQSLSIKNCMSLLTKSLNKNIFNKGEKTRLAFQIAFLHSLLNVREKYGAYGFHQRYYFYISSFQIVLEMALQGSDQNGLSLDFVRWVLSQFTYGGSIFDIWDKRSFEAFVSILITPTMLKPNEKIESSPLYLTPANESIEKWIEAIKAFPDKDSPGIFGLLSNCDLMLIQHQSNYFFSFLQCLTEKKIANYSFEVFIQKIQDIAAKVPSIDDISADDDNQSFSDPLMTILNSEAAFYSKLIGIIKETLRIMELQLTMKIKITPDVNHLFLDIFLNKVPKNWSLFPSKSKLSEWIQDLDEKVDFFNNWIRRGKPSWFNLSCFSNPRAFLYSLHKKYLKNNKAEIENLTFSVSFEELLQPIGSNDDSTVIGGILCNGMEWDKSKKMLVKSKADSLNECPFLRFKSTIRELRREPRIPPKNDENSISEGEKVQIYQCPIYRVMSLTQNFSGNENIVTAIALPVSGDINDLILNGAALFLANDN